MPRYTTPPTIGIGDVLVTREGKWWISAAIRLGAAIAKLPAFCNHVIIVHHVDADGTWWGIEGRPGGVGWVDIRPRLDHPLTNANNEQPKTEDQRFLIATAAEALLKTAYDWGSIADHFAAALHELVGRQMWETAADWQEGETPAHVVCSSFADWAYEKVGLPNPGGYARTRMTSPGDWDKFMMREEWRDDH